MKKVLSVLVILGFVIGMAACGNKKAEEEARIQDSIEQVRIQDSIAAVEAEALAVAEAEAALEQARLDSIAAAEVATTGKKTTVKKTTTVVNEVKEEVTPAIRKRPGATEVK